MLLMFFDCMFVVTKFHMSRREEPTTAELPKKEETFAQTIDFSHLFRVIGHKELMWPASRMNKSKMVGMFEFKGSKRVTVHARNLQCLDDFVFWQVTGETIKMEKVFDNLKDKFGDNLDLKFDKDMMEVMVPDYDPDKFKVSHGEKVLGWYLEIRTKINKANE